MATLNLNTTALVDLIGEMKARIAPTLKQLKTLEDKLKAEGPGRYAGLHYEANVFVSEREKLDLDAVRAKLSAQFLRANTSLTNVTTLKVTARQLGDDSLKEVRQPTKAELLIANGVSPSLVYRNLGRL